MKKIFQAPVELQTYQVVVWPAVGLFCKLEVLQEAISLVKGSLKLRCKLQEKIASCDSALSVLLFIKQLRVVNHIKRDV